MKSNNLKKLRIFAASPMDVINERARLSSVIDDLKALAEFVGVTLELAHWHQVPPDLGRAEQIILDQLKPDSWDIFIGILWHRFGTPTGGKDPITGKEYLSGTEEEFRVAYRLWQHHKRPRVMFYWCKRNVPIDDLDPVQFQRVKEFFAGFVPDAEHPGLYQSFDSTESFERLVRQNIIVSLIEYSKKVKDRSVSKDNVKFFVPTIPKNLPRRATFFGRENEMNAVIGALDPDERGWGVVIDGIGGIGKTALAVEAAYRCEEKGLFDAFIFISAKQKHLESSGIKSEIRAATTLNKFISETAHALGQPGISRLTEENKRHALFDILRTKRVLLIYDNLETLSKEEQEALADWLRFLPQGCKAILTTRRRGGEGAFWLRLGKLDWESAKKIIQYEAKRDPRMEKKLKCFELRWQELYDITGGSPLALIHILGLMRVRITLSFDSALEMLKKGGERESNLQKFIYEEARKELGVSDIKVLNALSFFVPAATFDALMATSDLSRTALDTVLDRLDSLSLVNKEFGEERYSLHTLTRTYIRDNLLTDNKLKHEMGIRFAYYWTDYAKLYGGYKKDSYKTFDKLEADWTNISNISQWLSNEAKVTDAGIGNEKLARMLSELASSLSFFLTYSGRWDEYLWLSEKAYYAGYYSQNWRNAGWRAFDMAWINYKRKHNDDASDWLDKCKDSWEREGTKGDQATALRLSGLIAQARKEYDVAEELLEKALRIRRSFSDYRETAFALNSLGLLAYELKKYELAEHYYLEALGLAIKIDDKVGQSIFWGNLADLALGRQQWKKAREILEKTLLLAQEVGRIELIADVHYGLAYIEEVEGFADLALPKARKALKIYDQLNHCRMREALVLVDRLTASLHINENNKR